MVNKRLALRAFLSSFARLVGVGFAAGAGTFLKQLAGEASNGWLVATCMTVISFTVMFLAEFYKESL